MQCIICGESADFYFSKSYAQTPFKELLPEEINYYKCADCGFVLSKTHADFTKERWGELNEAFHHWIEQPENDLEGKHSNRNTLDHHLTECDFVFCSDAGKNGFDLLFIFGERAVIARSEPFILGFPPKGFRDVQMGRIFRQKENV